MNNEKANGQDSVSASVVTRPAIVEQADARGIYTVECRGPDGVLKWRDTAKNVVTTAGKNHALDVFLRAQTPITSWFIGVISSVSFTAVAAADTMASHAGWTEAGPTNAPNYSQGTRPALTVGSAAAAGSLAASAASVYSITATGTIKGCFLTSVSTKDGTTGTLYSAGLFTGGDKVLANLDTLNVTYTASL